MTEVLKDRIILTYGVVGDHDGAYDWVRKEDYNKPEFSLGYHDGGMWDSYTVYEIFPLDEPKEGNGPACNPYEGMTRKEKEEYLSEQEKGNPNV